jgi:hypothetical protein
VLPKLPLAQNAVVAVGNDHAVRVSRPDALSLADDKVDVWLNLANESPLGEDLLLDLKEFTVRPMDRAMNNVRQKNLAAIDPEAAAA